MKDFYRPFGFVGSWLGNTPLQQLCFFFPSCWRRKTAYGICCKRLPIFTPSWLTMNSNKIPTFWLFFKYIISWEIRALKEYPLITKEAWIVLEAISKTGASCLTGLQTPQNNKSTWPAASCFRLFLGVWMPWSNRYSFFIYYIYMLNCHKGVKSLDLFMYTIFKICIDFISLWRRYLKFMLSCLSTHVWSENFGKLAALCVIQDQVHLLWTRSKLTQNYPLCFLIFCCVVPCCI